MNRKERRKQKFHNQPQESSDPRTPRMRAYPPKTIGQRNLKTSLENSRMVVTSGPAGSGKTLMSVQRCLELLMGSKVERIVLLRPAISSEEKVGYLPGGLREKLDPYLIPLYDAINDIMCDKRCVDMWIRTGLVQIDSIGFLRGRTFKSSAVVVDEAQNATYRQLKLVSTRLGEGSYMFFTGDTDQADIPDSGYPEFIERVLKIPDVSVVNMGTKDVLRDPIVAKLVEVL
jgi:phosphate starvation-inducible PhoH-like protein